MKPANPRSVKQIGTPIQSNLNGFVTKKKYRLSCMSSQEVHNK